MIGHLRSILNLRDERKNVTIYGGYAMAIKRNLSHSASAAMVATLGGEEERGGLKSKDAVIRFEHYTNLCQRYISRLFYSAARRDFDESARWRSSFSNVEVHVLMSDATNEDSVERSKVTVGFVWSTAASGYAIKRYEVAEGELQAEQQFSCTDLQDFHTGTAVETLKMFERQLQSVSCSTWREDAPARTHRIFILEVDSAGNTILGGKMIRRMSRAAKWATSAVLVQPRLWHQHGEYVGVLCSSRCVEIQWRERGAIRFGALCNFEC